MRATCNVTLQELPTASRSPTRPRAKESTTSHRVVAGDTLASIAWAEYQDPPCGGSLAVANNIDDPLRLREGTIASRGPSPDTQWARRCERAEPDAVSR